MVAEFNWKERWREEHDDARVEIFRFIFISTLDPASRSVDDLMTQQSLKRDLDRRAKPLELLCRNIQYHSHLL